MMQDYLGINSCSEAGLRPANEDAYWVEPDERWMVMIDGIGGPGKGDLAASLVLEALHAAVRGDGPAGERIEAALRQANQAMISRALTNPHLKGMGAAVTMAVLEGAKLLVWHVGDTRLYAVRGGKVVCLTEDHNLAAFLVKQKQITHEQAKTHAGRHTLLRSLGKDAALKLDHFEYQVRTEDRFVFATDGVYLHCPEAVWLEHLTAPLDECQASALVQAALAGGSEDNATALVVDLRKPIGEVRKRSTQYFPKFERLEVFIEFSQEAIGCTTLAALHDLVLLYTLRISNTERAMLLSLRDDGTLVTTAHRGVSQFVDTVSFAETYARKVMDSGESFWSEDVTSDPTLDVTKSVSSLSLRSIICIPLQTGSSVSSVLYADRAGTAAAFTRQDFDLLTALTLYARLFQENVGLQEVQRRQLRHMQVMHELHESMANLLDPAAVYKEALSKCVAVSRAERGYILIGSSLRCMVSLDAAGRQASPEAFDATLIDEVRQLGKPVVRVTNPAVGAQSHLGLDLRTVLCAPLVVRQRFLGAVYLSANSLNVSFDDDDIRLIHDLAVQAALHLEAAVLHDEMRKANLELEGVLSQIAGDPPAASGTTGSLHEIGGLHFLLRRLMSEGRTGLIQVRQGGRHGAVTLADGVIVQASSAPWAVFGDDAMAEMFSWREGEWQISERPAGKAEMARKDFLFIPELRTARRWMEINAAVRPDSLPICLSDKQAGLSEAESHVLRLVGKDRSALEIAQASHMPYHEALWHLLDLEKASLVTWAPLA
jgi:serine/threonine protein phosphatase PrpC/GAF domain-containing protein